MPPATDDSPKARSPHPLRRLLPLVHEHWLAFWGGMALICLGRVFEAGVPLMVRLSINRIAGHDGRLMLPVVTILILAVCRYFSVAWGRKCVRQVGVVVTYDLRERLYAHFQLQGPRFFARYPTGDLMARAINDLNLVRQMIGVGSRTVIVLGFSGIIAFCFMVGLSPGLTVWLLPVMPFIAGAGFVISTQLYRQSLRVQEGFSTLSEFVQENLNGIRTIQTHAQEDREIARFRTLSDEYAQNYFRLMVLNASLGAWMTALTGVSTLIIVGYGGYLVLHHALSIGTFSAFILYLGMVVAPIQQAGQMVTMFQRGSSAAARLFEVLDWQAEIQDAPGAAALPRIGGAISVRHLSFSYPPRVDARDSINKHDLGEGWLALDDISLEIKAGEMIAILGRVGSGKSTLLKLMVRLLDPPQGSVYLDGCDVRLLPLAQVRGEIAMVPQEPFLFADELGRNISYDNPRREVGEVWSAAEAADLEDTIASFPERLSTLVGERGVTLSGGQKQRTSLARGLIRDTPILLLDDCFSSVDTETEEHILSRLKQLRGGRTTLLVSHRVSTARHADRILVLDAGRVAELGTHAELMARNGIYAHFARAQGRREALAQAMGLNSVAEAAK
ncbi:MAG: ABC transporter ATP-binding protein [Alphaproteobacteria bacterium]|nr:ABC transporter ATP-binding protein [Alphaproteobacteria bacterium]